MLKNFSIQLENVVYTIPPETYTESFGDNKCNVLVKYRDDSSESIILGNYFIQDFVLSYNYADVTVKFGVNINSPSGTSIAYFKEPPISNQKVINIIGICTILLMIVIVILVCIYCRYIKKYKTEKEADAIAYAEPLHAKSN